MSVLKIMNNGVWEDVAGVSGHTHKMSEISDFPADLLDAVNDLQTNIGDAPVADQIAAAVVDKADADHTHSEYASVDHTHSQYSDVDHTHSQYADKEHTHSQYASASDVAGLQTLVGSTNVSEQIDTAIDNIDYPVKSVNGKTGAVALTASDVGALPSNTVIPSVAGLASEDYVDNAVSAKVDKVSGKALSTNDYTTAEKNKLADIEFGANKTVVDAALNAESTNPVQNKAVQAAVSDLQTMVGNRPVSEQIETAISELKTAILGGAW